MFRSTDFYDWFASHIASPWWMYLIMGINFVLVAVLMLLLPQRLAALVAAFLIVDGVILLALALRVCGLKRDYQRWVRDLRHPFE